MSQIAVVVNEPSRAATISAIACATAGFTLSAPDPSTLNDIPNAKLVFTDESHLTPVLRALGAGKARVVILWEKPQPELIAVAVGNPSVIGFLGTRAGLAEPWELMYVARRVLVPTERPPQGSQLLPWGSTAISWQPRTTVELRRIVTQIEGIGRNLGMQRREASAVSAAAHELLMNAMYDAPVDARGVLLYAQDRQSDIALSEAQSPTLRFAVGPTLAVLDASDPFGRLPRQRYFESVQRGLHNSADASAVSLDMSHGGAGLGLHKLFATGCLLRAELRPLQSTLVSWMMRRTAPGERLPESRSLFFMPVT